MCPQPPHSFQLLKFKQKPRPHPLRRLLLVREVPEARWFLAACSLPRELQNGPCQNARPAACPAPHLLLFLINRASL